MTVIADARVTLVVSRHLLLFMDDQAGGIPAFEDSQLVGVGSGALSLLCAASDMGATVILERHDAAPSVRPGSEWNLASEGDLELPTGNVLVANLEGDLERLPKLGLSSGRWQFRVHVAGRDEAVDLEDQLIEEIGATFDSGIGYDDSAFVTGPEKWLVQLWP